MNKSLRDALLALDSGPKGEIIDIGELKVELRPPTIKLRDMIRAKANANKDDLGPVLAHALINCAYEPGTLKKVFEQTDLPALLEMTCGSFVDVCGAKILAMMNVEAPAKGKASERTADVSSSSESQPKLEG